jgi:hypothetical protein
MFTEDSFGFSVTCNVSGVFAWFWQFLVGRLFEKREKMSGLFRFSVSKVERPTPEKSSVERSTI